MIAWCCLWLLVGCSRETAEREPAPAVEPDPSVVVEAAAPKEVEVALEEADAARLAEVIANNRGKVVLVDYWALW